MPRARCASLTTWVEGDGCTPQAASDQDVERDWLNEIEETVSPTAERLADAAFLRAAMGEFDGAIERQEEAVAVGRSAHAVRQLVALHLLRETSKTSQATDLLSALALAAKAIAEGDSSGEMSYLLAITLERLGFLHEPSRLAEEALRLAPEAPWRPEAQRLRDRRSSESPSQHWQESRDGFRRDLAEREFGSLGERIARAAPSLLPVVLEDLLIEWAQQEPVNSIAEALEALLWQAAEALQAATRDGSWVEVSCALPNLSRKARESLFEALRQLRAGREALMEGTNASARRAEKAYESASALLPDPLEPLVAEAGMELATARRQRTCNGEVACQRRRKLAEEELARVPSWPESWAGLRARAHWLSGWVAVRRSDYGAALTGYEESLRLYGQLQDGQHQAYLRGLIAETRQALGSTQESWLLLRDALAGLQEIHQPVRRHNLYFWLMDYLGAIGAHPAALVVAREYATDAQASGDLVSQAEAALMSARILGKLGRFEEGLDQLRGAARFERQIGEAAPGRLSALLQAEEIALLSGSNPQQAVQEADALIEQFEAKDLIFQARGVLVHKIKALENQHLSSEGAILQAIEEVEAQRLLLGRDLDRLAMASQDRSLYDQLARTRLDQGDNAAAWQALQGDRGRALIELLSGQQGLSPPPPPELAAVQQALPEEVTLFEFAVWPDRVVTWRIDRHGPQRAAHIWRIPGAELVAQVNALRRDRHKKQGAALYRNLFGDLATGLPPNARLLIVPDGPLATLPWPALYDDIAQRWLIEGWELTKLPSAALLVFAAPTATLFERNTPVLFVANPALSGTEKNVYPDLIDSEDLYDHIRDQFPRTQRRVGGEASRQVLDDAKDFPILHFDTHGLSSPRAGYSSLVLSPTGEGGADYLLAKEVIHYDLSAVSLVVLAACETALGAERAPGEPRGLVRSILGAGTEGVIASLWNVRSEETSVLFARFYAHLSAGLDPSAALRQAQLEMLAEFGVGDWMAFEYVGPR